MAEAELSQFLPRSERQIRCFTWWALVIGLVCGVAATAIFELTRQPGPSPIRVLGGICYSLSRPGLMIFYVLVIVRLAQNIDRQRRLAPLAAAGRMPLTNYLMQMPWSLWWLKRHERGPLEAMWAQLTNGRAADMVSPRAVHVVR
jgi:uncharacterized protein